jgi:hypothetical protein
MGTVSIKALKPSRSMEHLLPTASPHRSRNAHLFQALSRSASDGQRLHWRNALVQANLGLVRQVAARLSPGKGLWPGLGFETEARCCVLPGPFGSFASGPGPCRSGGAPSNRSP